MAEQTEHTTEPGRQASQTLQWLETVLITVFCFALGAWNRPDDPFYLTGNFPWPMIGPLLAGLRYGFAMALVGALLTAVGLGLYQRYLTDAAGTFPFVWAAGVFSVTLLAGEFRDYWERRRNQLSASNDYREARLEEFTRNYYLLKVSHDRLEQQLAGSSRSLREALRRLYTEMDNGQQGLTTSRANAILQLLSRYGQLQTAAIFRTHNRSVDREPVATLGQVKPLAGADPLIQHCLEEAKLISIQTEYLQRQAELDTRFLAVIPFIDSTGQITALCAIEAMPFFTFEPQTLRFLAILTGHIADLIGEQDMSRPGETQELRSLRRQVARVGRDADTYKLPASLVSLRMPDSLRAQQVGEHIKRVRRGLDLIYECKQADQYLLVVLMPLTDELGMAGYLQRLEDGIREKLGLRLGDWGVEPQTLIVSSQADAEAWLEEALSHG